MLNKKIIYYLIIIACVSGIPMSAAGTAEEQYYKTEVSYRKFVSDPEKMQYRENWLKQIEEFQNAYRMDPSGSLAPAALYMAGQLYQELYRRSSKLSDKNAFLDYFRRVVRWFPKSDYKPKAEAVLADFARKQTPNPGTSEKAEIPKEKTEENVRVEKKMRGQVFKASKEEYKASLRSVRKIAETDKPRTEKLSDFYPQPAVRELPASSGGDSLITGLRFWSNPSYTRVVIDADKETPYSHKLLESNDPSRTPQRLYVDFAGSDLGKGIDKVLPINDDLLISVRAGRQEARTVRVVVDIKSFKTYKIFSLRNPFRTIVDVWGGGVSNHESYAGRLSYEKPKIKEPERFEAESSQPERKKSGPSELERMEQPEPVKPNDLARQLGLGVKRIVIDPGHGGHDGGAPGYEKDVHEKDVVLSIARRLATKVRQRLGCEVIMTRSTDRFLSLEERTAIANTRNADLFISIHTNAHTDSAAYGIETYFLNLATDEDAIRVAARENATTRKNISDLQKILTDLMQNAKINESSRLATYIQKSLYNRIRNNYSKVKNKGVKQAPFYVLLGARMPSVLIETSFISNKTECARLTDPNYQEQLCDAITDGVRNYIKETNPTALLRTGDRLSSY